MLCAERSGGLGLIVQWVVVPLLRHEVVSGTICFQVLYLGHNTQLTDEGELSLHCCSALVPKVVCAVAGELCLERILQRSDVEEVSCSAQLECGRRQADAAQTPWNGKLAVSVAWVANTSVWPYQYF